jgi:diguanylate cyclase (GGDEF)-like protein
MSSFLILIPLLIFLDYSRIIKNNGILFIAFIRSMQMANEQKKIIIAVDDILENLLIIKEILKNLYEVYACQTALNMFELLQHITPDIILLDVEMPVMNGYEAIKKLKSDEKYKQIPVIFLTARDDVKSEVDGLSMGAVDYIHKPFISSLLIQRIKTHLVLMEYQKIEIINMATVIAMENIKEGFVLVDDKNNYLSSNPASKKMFPDISKLSKGESIFSISCWPNDLKNNENNPVEFSITGKSTRYYKASISPVIIDNETFIARIFLFMDITDNVILLKELEEAAYIDSLTGIYNRKHFLELADTNIKRAARMEQTVFVAMIDIDFFKKVNDTYGHYAGDIVLKGITGIVSKTIRAYDLFGRFGGEEFLVLFTVTDKMEAYNMTERIRKNIEQSVINFEDHELKLTVSIGLAQLSEDHNIENAIRNSDKALYEAKNSGRNQVKIYGE